MKSRERNDENPVRNESPVSPAKVNMVESFKNPLHELIDICGSITAPSQDDLKDMLKDYKVVVGDELWYNIFVSKWRDFFNLPDLLKCIAAKYSYNNSTLSYLCEEMLDDINNCQDLIEETILSKPEQGDSKSKKIDESFYDLIASKFHKTLNRICTQLNIYYLPKLITASHPLTNNKVATSKPDTPEYQGPTSPLTDALQDVWNFLEHNYYLTAKEIRNKIAPGVTENALQQRIIKINKSGRVIKNKPGLGYYRPDTLPEEIKH